MPPQRCLPSPGPTWLMVLETVGSRAARSVGVWACCPGKGLAGVNYSAPLLLCILDLGVVLIVLGFSFTSVDLPCSAWCGRGRGSYCPCTGKGVQRCAPSFVH